MKKMLLSVGVASSLFGCEPPSCVARGSRVRTPSGNRPIEDLRVGDEVVVADPATGLTAESRLEAVVKSERECGTLRFAGRALSVTSDHPLYDPLARGFFPAGDWLLGLRTHLFEITDAGAAAVRVETFETFTRIDEVFDLTVAHEWHTFIAEDVLVHNKQPYLPNCTAPGGELVTSLDPQSRCSCLDGGVGRWACPSDGATAVCRLCTQPDDGGSSDGGP